MEIFKILENDGCVTSLEDTIKAENGVTYIEEALNRLLLLPSTHPARISVLSWADEILD